MKTQRFVGGTHHEAMRQVRLALGADALIVSSRRGEAGVEIIATAESAVPDADNTPTLSRPVGAPSPASGRGEPEHAQTSSDVMAAIDALRGTLESRIDIMAWDTQIKRAPASAALFQTLLAAGFSTPLLRTLLARLPDCVDPADSLAWARNELLTQLPVLRHEDELWDEGGVVALVGPTGVGKTTTVAKLAARCVLRVGADRVAMLTTDSYRIGAYEQLQIYGRLMQVPVHGVRDAAQLRQTLAQLGERDLILIDNVGLSQRDRQVAEQAAMLCAAGRRVRRLLVLNAASHGDTLDEVARAYRGGENDQGPALAGCILTKLDEAPRLGAALDIAMRYRLPVHYVSHGQKVPEDMDLADGPALLERALAQAQESPALYAPNQADLGALWSAAPAPDQTEGPRRRQLLVSALTGGASDTAELDTALAWVQDDPLMALTRASVAQQTEFDVVRVSLEHAVRQAFAPHCQSHLLAVHGTTALKNAGAPSTSRLASTLLMSDRGASIAATHAQWLSAQGPQMSLASWSGPDPGAPLAAPAALRIRIARLGQDYPQLPLVHLLEGATAGLWQHLSQAGVAWLSKVGGAARVILDDGATTAQALARTVHHAPVPPAASANGAACTLWAGETPVRVAVRAGALLRLVSVRVIDKASGALTARLLGLSNLAPDEVKTARLASWLVQQHAAKSAFRFMAHAWQAATPQAGVADLRRHALWASQLGLASWHLAHTPSAQALRRVLEKLTGYTSASALPGALLRLFALLDMAES